MGRILSLPGDPGIRVRQASGSFASCPLCLAEISAKGAELGQWDGELPPQGCPRPKQDVISCKCSCDDQEDSVSHLPKSPPLHVSDEGTQQGPESLAQGHTVGPREGP